MRAGQQGSSHKHSQMLRKTAIHCSILRTILLQKLAKSTCLTVILNVAKLAKLTEAEKLFHILITLFAKKLILIQLSLHRRLCDLY